METRTIVGALAASMLLVSACSRESATGGSAPARTYTTPPAAASATVVDDAAMADEQRFSPLREINAGNVSELGVDWYLPLPDARGLVSTPLVVDGVMYFVESMNRIRAVDATNGDELWVWDPKVYEHSDMRVGCGVSTTRGCRSTTPAHPRFSRAWS